jgi:hypothetical protein
MRPYLAENKRIAKSYSAWIVLRGGMNWVLGTSGCAKQALAHGTKTSHALLAWVLTQVRNVRVESV